MTITNTDLFEAYRVLSANGWVIRTDRFPALKRQLANDETVKKIVALVAELQEKLIDGAQASEVHVNAAPKGWATEMITEVLGIETLVDAVTNDFKERGKALVAPSQAALGRMVGRYVDLEKVDQRDGWTHSRRDFARVSSVDVINPAFGGRFGSEIDGELIVKIVAMPMNQSGSVSRRGRTFLLALSTAVAWLGASTEKPAHAKFRKPTRAQLEAELEDLKEKYAVES